ncbi:uncharacterized protein LOC126743034 [Anthonomus grandis grandis]|uniref:uncharacterized protein LOC126743034 n=1 Tax=Anthonomus grandis grandis TaxID=2921223 RepID=UPI0021662AF0|nr:uncharacterized protein LOC126743034 [Anthonomus grandis grandis]
MADNEEEQPKEIPHEEQSPPSSLEPQEVEELRKSMQEIQEPRKISISDGVERRRSSHRASGIERRTSAAGERRISVSGERRISTGGERRVSVSKERRASADVEPRTSIKGASIRGSEMIESFIPPEVRAGFHGRQASLQPSRSDTISPSIQRKSKFGLTSKARMVLGSIVDIKTNAGEAFDRRVAKYQNSYRLESQNPFNAEKVDKILKEVMNELIENLQYDPEKCAQTAKVASGLIRTRVKGLDFERYKLVCIVTIGEKNSQDVYATCRFLWDAEKDRYAYYALENTHVYAIAYCFGLYYE